jgi:5-methylcytosine-specific restriction endonuclease McrA
VALRDASHRELGLQKWKDQRLRVLKRDGYICAYCGQEANQVDHVISRKDGGSHDLDNLVACCAPCNSKKGALNEGVFLGKTSTPPVFSGHIYPMQSEPMLDSPFTVRPNPSQ